MLPTDALVKFILCDAAREEKDDKISLLGVYPDGIVRLPLDARFPAAFPLALVFFLLDGEGSFDCKFEIKSPPPQPPFGATLPNVLPKNTNQPGTIMLNFTPFVAGGFGKYEVILSVNNQTYIRSFEVGPILPKVVPAGAIL
jgi:hypothetical protein